MWKSETTAYPIPYDRVSEHLITNTSGRKSTRYVLEKQQRVRAALGPRHTAPADNAVR